MYETTLAHLRDSLGNGKFKIGDVVRVKIGLTNVSKRIKQREGHMARVIGYRDYYKGKHNYGGNRYYVEFLGGYVAGIFPCNLTTVTD